MKRGSVGVNRNAISFARSWRMSAFSAAVQSPQRRRREGTPQEKQVSPGLQGGASGSRSG
jgi:hypothetical protein